MGDRKQKLHLAGAILIFLASLINYARIYQISSLKSVPAFHVMNKTRFFTKSNEPQQTQLNQNRRLDETTNTAALRVLYIVTSLSEFDNGERATVEGNDRFSRTLVPVVSESTKSMISQGFDVTVILISHYPLNKKRYAELKESLPSSTPLFVWPNATPYGYAPDNEKGEDRIDLITRALARQHRFVIKDLWHAYDLFVAFEDDMLIHGAHVTNYYETTQHLYQLRSRAPPSLPILERPFFFGPMTQIMLQRMIPGFIRVEVVPSADWKPPSIRRKINNPIAQSSPGIPVDYTWTENTKGNKVSPQTAATFVGKIDPSICCHRSSSVSQPSIEQLHFWETSIEALSVRELPDQSWVLLQAGNDESIYEGIPNVQIGEFWTGQDHEDEYFQGKPRPYRSQGDYLNNQGGWMATRGQIYEWHTEVCMGGFLPPYDPPVWQNDGLSKPTVEFWSGGIQIVGVKSCNLQRAIPLQPEAFSRSLLYHTSNNKQRQKYVMHRFSKTNIQEFWGQLNSVRKNAEQRKTKVIQELESNLVQKNS